MIFRLRKIKMITIFKSFNQGQYLFSNKKIYFKLNLIKRAFFILNFQQHPDFLDFYYY